MRTTITLDKDIAARLQHLRGNGSFKQLVNQALRLGLERIERPEQASAPYRMQTVAGGPRVFNVDNIGRVLDELDREHESERSDDSG